MAPRGRTWPSHRRPELWLFLSSACLFLSIYSQFRSPHVSFARPTATSAAPKPLSVAVPSRPSSSQEPPSVALPSRPSSSEERLERVAKRRSGLITELRALLDVDEDAQDSWHRGDLHEVISRLEALAPSPDPLTDDLINGQWIVKHSGSFSPGMFASPLREMALPLYAGGFSLGGLLKMFEASLPAKALFLTVDELKVEISNRKDVIASATLDVLGSSETISYTAELQPRSLRRMTEDITSMSLPFPLGTQRMLLPMRREILVTYLDRDIMIVRDESGFPDVLMREATDSDGNAAEADAPSEPPSSLVNDGKVDFSGTWKVIGHQGNVDKWMADLGYGRVMRGLAKAARYGKNKATLNIVQDGDRFVETRNTGLRPKETIEYRIDGTSQKVKTLDGEELITPAWDGYNLEVDSRSLDGRRLLKMRRYLVDENTLIMETTSLNSNIKVTWRHKRT